MSIKNKQSKWLSLFILAVFIIAMLLMQGLAFATQKPTIDPDGGIYTSTQSVTIGNIPDGCVAYYTTDGSNPTTSNTALIFHRGSFTISESGTVKAAVYDPEEGWSSVTSATFIINKPKPLQAPTIDPDGGTFDSAQKVTIGNIPAGCLAYYTTDGSDPTKSDTALIFHGSPFTISESGTIKAAVHDPEEGWSSVTSATFVINKPKPLQAPTIDPDGGTFDSAQKVTIGNIPDGAIAYYTTDGSNPTKSKKAVIYKGAFTVSESGTVKAAVYDPEKGWSSVTSVTFVINKKKNNNRDQIEELKQQLFDAISNNQIKQAKKILQEIKQLTKHTQNNEDT